ncbi:hypothetical protein [Nocardioides perillae]|uniref:Mce-associated membrane protein n=1 Tax=Nocardioides perillae TaxID=1119534 RepID=A0A7Y9UMH3_9ACTN|nr:hypothetical protein [Nocardioides perillae]NYG55421.1 hypothetical protein [Nocardioides perillae]
MPPRSTPLLAVLAVLVALLAGCTDGPAPERGSGDDPATADRAAGRPALTTTVRPGEVVGRLPVRARRAALRGVREAVDGWVDAAYVAGPWPRRDFSRAFPRFTRGARQQAYRDARLLSNVGIGPRVEAVQATQRRVVVDLLARDRRVQAATARVRLAFRTRGEVERTVRVRGRLFLTLSPGGWRVFGYDLVKEGRP